MFALSLLLALLVGISPAAPDDDPAGTAASALPSRISREVDGLRITETFDARGRVMERVEERDAAVVLRRTWYADSSPAWLRRTGADGFVLEERRWSERGVLLMMDRWDPERRTRVERAWSEDGTLVFRGTTKDGIRVGTWKTWYPNGRLKSRARYGTDKDVEDCVQRIERRRRRLERDPVLGVFIGQELEDLRARCSLRRGRPVGPVVYWGPRGRVRLRMQLQDDGTWVFVERDGSTHPPANDRVTVQVRSTSVEPDTLEDDLPGCRAQEPEDCARHAGRRFVLADLRRCGVLGSRDPVHAWWDEVELDLHLHATASGLRFSIARAHAPGATGPFAACIADLPRRRGASEGPPAGTVRARAEVLVAPHEPSPAPLPDSARSPPGYDPNLGSGPTET